MQMFNVQGMSCGHCVRAITQAVQAQRPGGQRAASIWLPEKWASRVH